MTSWSELLDQMEQRLADVEMSIARKPVLVAPFEMPEGIGPIPPECRERALRVHAATRSAELRLSGVMSQVGLEIGRRSGDRPPPVLFDRKI